TTGQAGCRASRFIRTSISTDHRSAGAQRSEGGGAVVAADSAFRVARSCVGTAGRSWVKEYGRHAWDVFRQKSSIFTVSPDGTVEVTRTVYYRRQPPRPPAPEPRPRRKNKDEPKVPE